MSNPIPKPTIGRIVHYTLKSGHVRPAIVVGEWVVRSNHMTGVSMSTLGPHLIVKTRGAGIFTIHRQAE